MTEKLWALLIICITGYSIISEVTKCICISKRGYPPKTKSKNDEEVNSHNDQSVCLTKESDDNETDSNC